MFSPDLWVERRLVYPPTSRKSLLGSPLGTFASMGKPPLSPQQRWGSSTCHHTRHCASSIHQLVLGFVYLCIPPCDCAPRMQVPRLTYFCLLEAWPSRCSVNASETMNLHGLGLWKEDTGGILYLPVGTCQCMSAREFVKAVTCEHFSVTRGLSKCGRHPLPPPTPF